MRSLEEVKKEVHQYLKENTINEKAIYDMEQSIREIYVEYTPRTGFRNFGNRGFYNIFYNVCCGGEHHHKKIAEVQID